MAERLDTNTVAALDELFNAWLALNGVISRDGALYQVDPKGKVLLDAQGKELRVVPEQFRLLINDPTQGFNAFVARKGIKVTPIQRDFPDQSR